MRKTRRNNMPKSKKKKNGYHKMPSGMKMKDSAMKKMRKKMMK